MGKTFSTDQLQSNQSDKNIPDSNSLFQSLVEITHVEMSKLSKNGLPRCIAIGDNNIIINQYRIEKHNNSEWHVFCFKTKEKIGIFSSRRVAFFFCLFKSIGNNLLAEKLYYNDERLCIAHNEANIFRKKITRCKDHNRKDILTVRLETAIFVSKKVETLINKTINLGKFSIIGACQ